MYNNKFIDLMDKINVTAKSMNFTNGISWARNAFENKKLNQLEYNDYKKCLLNTPRRMVRIDRWSWCIVAV